MKENTLLPTPSLFCLPPPYQIYELVAPLLRLAILRFILLKDVTGLSCSNNNSSPQPFSRWSNIFTCCTTQTSLYPLHQPDVNHEHFCNELTMMSKQPINPNIYLFIHSITQKFTESFNPSFIHLIKIHLINNSITKPKEKFKSTIKNTRIELKEKLKQNSV